MRRANPQARTHVRMSALVDIATHSKLAAIAVLRGVDRGVLAGGLIKAALSSVVVRDVPTAQGIGPPDENLTGL